MGCIGKGTLFYSHAYVPITKNPRLYRDRLLVRHNQRKATALINTNRPLNPLFAATNDGVYLLDNAFGQLYFISFEKFGQELALKRSARAIGKGKIGMENPPAPLKFMGKRLLYSPMQKISLTKDRLRVKTGEHLHHNDGPTEYLFSFPMLRMLSSKKIVHANNKHQEDTDSKHMREINQKRLLAKHGVHLNKFPDSIKTKILKKIVYVHKIRILAPGHLLITVQEIQDGPPAVSEFLLSSGRVKPVATKGIFYKVVSKTEAIFVQRAVYYQKTQMTNALHFFDFKKNKVVKTIMLPKGAHIFTYLYKLKAHLLVLLFDYKKEFTTPCLIDLKTKIRVPTAKPFTGYPSHCMMEAIDPKERYLAIASQHFGFVLLTLFPRPGETGVIHIPSEPGIRTARFSNSGDHLFVGDNRGKLWAYKIEPSH